MGNNVSTVFLAVVGLASGALSHRLGTEERASPAAAQTEEASGRELVSRARDDRFSGFLKWLPTASLADLEVRYVSLTDPDQFQHEDLAIREMVLQRWIALNGKQIYHYAKYGHGGDLWELVASPQGIVQRWALAYPVGLLEATVEGPWIAFGILQNLWALPSRRIVELK